MAQPVAGRPQVLVARRDRGDPGRVERVARCEQLRPGRRRGDVRVGEDLLVEPHDVRDVGRVGDHDDLAVDRVLGQRRLVEQAGKGPGLEGVGEVRRVAVLVALLEAGTGPLEVDVGGVAAGEQVLQADRLVQVVVLVVHLDLRVGMRRLELPGDVVPDADLGLAGRTHRDAQDVVVLRGADRAAGGREQRPRGEREHALGGRGHRDPPVSSLSDRPGRTKVPVTSARVMSTASPNTRTRASRSRAR